MLQDPQYLPDLHQLVSKDTDASDTEAWKGLKTVLEFGMGITLRRATQQPETQGGCCLFISSSFSFFNFSFFFIYFLIFIPTSFYELKTWRGARSVC